MLGFNKQMDNRIKLFFFFQAEDGIRDGTVTGVQTCGLPIFSTSATRANGKRRMAWSAGGGPAAKPKSFRPVHFTLQTAWRWMQLSDTCMSWKAIWIAYCGRSEERRVGKRGGSVSVGTWREEE